MPALLKHLRSNVISYAALFVALGGTSYAAITLPNNSVGNAQLRDNAVTSKEVKNRSLRKSDFATGQLPAGPRGPQGPAGPAGPAGAAAGGGTSLWAVVRTNGTLVKGSGVDAVARANPGSYGVAFKQSIVGCAQVVSIGGYTAGSETSVPPPGVIRSWVSATGPEVLTRTVNVETDNLNGVPEDRPFHVAVFC